MTFPVRQAQFRALDQYYTRPETAARCLVHLDTVLPDLSADLYLEPSAGDGAFLSLMRAPRIGLDVAPAAVGIETADFLTWSPLRPQGASSSSAKRTAGRGSSRLSRVMRACLQSASPAPGPCGYGAARRW